jgi:hypothetical protein
MMSRACRCCGSHDLKWNGTGYLCGDCGRIFDVEDTLWVDDAASGVDESSSPAECDTPEQEETTLDLTEGSQARFDAKGRGWFEAKDGSWSVELPDFTSPGAASADDSAGGHDESNVPLSDDLRMEHDAWGRGWLEANDDSWAVPLDDWGMNTEPSDDDDEEDEP